MKKLYMKLSLCLVVGMASTGFAQTAAKDTHDEIEQTTKAATIFREIMSAPDKAIPRRILDDADCIAVFPQVIKAAFGIGGRGGPGGRHLPYRQRLERAGLPERRRCQLRFADRRRVDRLRHAVHDARKRKEPS